MSLTIETWLRQAQIQLKAAGISSAQLDAELILAYTIKASRTFLHTHGELVIKPSYQEIADARLALRKERVPLAYITGHKEFYGRNFQVSTATLIPRPESEAMIDELKKIAKPIDNSRLADIGTGSGCLGITAKLEHPTLQVSLLDISRPALQVAKRNATNLKASVDILKSDLLANYPFKATYILANLPYVDPAWPRSPETNYEPAEALFAKDGGRNLISRLLRQLPTSLVPHGYVLLEADPSQHATLLLQANSLHLYRVAINGYCLVLQYEP